MAAFSSEHERRVKSLINGLIAKTRATDSSRISWEAVTRDRFELSMSRATVTIESRDGDGADPYEFVVRDEAGLPFISVDYDTQNYAIYGLRDLFESVALNSTGADEKIVSLLNELGIEEPPF